MDSTKKTAIVVFLYALLFKFLVCSTLAFSTEASLFAFPLCSILFTWMCIEGYKSANYTTSKIVLTILAGELILTLPIRIIDFYGTKGSLPYEILGIIGILLGWLLACKHKVWLLLLVFMALIFPVYIYYWLQWHGVIPE